MCVCVCVGSPSFKLSYVCIWEPFQPAGCFIVFLPHLVLHTAQLAAVTTVAMETCGVSKEKALDKRQREDEERENERKTEEKEFDRGEEKDGRLTDKRGREGAREMRRGKEEREGQRKGEVGVKGERGRGG